MGIFDNKIADFLPGLCPYFIPIPIKIAYSDLSAPF